MPIDLTGGLPYIVAGIATLLVYNKVKKVGEDKGTLPAIGQIDKAWAKSWKGQGLALAVALLAVGAGEHFGVIAGFNTIMQGLPVIGDYWMFSVQPLSAAPASGGTQQQQTQQPYQAGTSAYEQPLRGAACIGLASPPDLTPNGYDGENPGTSLTDTGVYRIRGQTVWEVFTVGTEISDIGAANDVLEVVYGVNTSSHIDRAHGPVFSYTVKCKEDDTIEKMLYNDENEDGLTGTFYNQDGNAAAQSMTVGQTKTVYLQFESGKDEVFGNPFIATSGLGDNSKHRAKYPNLLLLELNKTTLEKPEKVWIFTHPISEDVNVELREITCPSLATTTSAATNYCYEMPVIYDSLTKIAVKLEADGTYAPANDATSRSYSGAYFIDAETGSLEWGVEDEDNNAVGVNFPYNLTIDLT